MKLFLKKLLISFCVMITGSMIAQLDSNNGIKEKGKTKTIVLKNTKEVNKPKSIDLNASQGFKNAHKELQEKLNQQEAEKALNNKGVLTKAQLHNLRIKELYGKRDIEKVDSPQGDFLTLSKSLTISFRDFGAIDGDVIAIYLNGVLVVDKTTLNQHYKSFQMNLQQGNNTIEIMALNQGTLGANTAQYKLVDNNGLKIASQYWFLATGAKAIFNVTKN